MEDKWKINEYTSNIFLQKENYITFDENIKHQPSLDFFLNILRYKNVPTTNTHQSIIAIF